MAILSSLYTGSLQTTGSFGKVFVDGSVTASEYTGVFKGALSSSAQIASDISGSFTQLSASLSGSVADLEVASGSFSSRVTTVEGNVGGQALNTTDSPTFAGMTVQGTLTAEELIVSSSVTNMVVAEKSGSTIFGDTTSDTH